MPRYMLRNSLAAVLVGAAAASSATAQDIMITGPAERVVGRTNVGAEIVEYTTSLVVNFRDLDLASAAGWNAMERRLTTASRNACKLLEQRNPTDLPHDRYKCERSAYREAIVQVRELRTTPSS